MQLRMLARNCLECHNGSDKKGGLDLTRRERAGGWRERGRSCSRRKIPKPASVVHRIEAGEMPPKGETAISAAERAAVREWIKSGAKWAATR